MNNFETTYQNTKGNRVLKVYGKLNGDSQTHYEAELFVKGISQGLEAITKGQIKSRYPIFVTAEVNALIAIN
tara:strand:- start:634 stop:849 length:216 start_codon:yes stop_codon:yes gene_type:complete